MEVLMADLLLGNARPHLNAHQYFEAADRSAWSDRLPQSRRM
jgi:hypothetical protein